MPAAADRRDQPHPLSPPAAAPPTIRRVATLGRWGRFLGIMTVLGVVLRLIAGPGPVLSPLPTHFEVRPGPTVTAAQTRVILAMAEHAEGILAGYVGGHLPGLTLFIEADRAALARDLSAWLGVPESDAWRVVSAGAWVEARGAIFVNLTPPRAAASGDAFWAVAHEEAHAFQERLVSPALGGWLRGSCWASHGSTMAPSGPMWLIEGSADRFALHTLTNSAYWAGWAQGRTDEEVSWEIATPAYAASGVRLQFLAAATPLSDEGYGLAFAAVTRLEAQTSWPAVVRYWRLLGEGLCWDQAFEEAFGMTPNQFYDDFEANRPPAGG